MRKDMEENHVFFCVFSHRNLLESSESKKEEWKLAYYEKKISYLDYVEHGVKIKNAGFIRIEADEKECVFYLKIRGIGHKNDGLAEICDERGQAIGSVGIREGGGERCLKFPERNVSGRDYRSVCGIFIRLPEGREVRTMWKMPREDEENGQETEQAVKEDSLFDESFQEEKNSQNQKNQEKKEEKFREISVLDQRKEEKEAPALEAAESFGEKERGEAIQNQKSEREEIPETLCMADKWEQLKQMYPSIHPFGDERMFLSIAPKDFVIMRKEYQNMVHNSFLLHGYYNYRHIILGRYEEKEGPCYYLGVPGNYYTRECMVAQMFGFEAFEGEQTPSQSGDFGYYMKKVEI